MKYFGCSGCKGGWCHGDDWMCVPDSQVMEESMKEILEKFLTSEDFEKGVIAATKAGWGGSGYSVELFPDGTWRVLWDNEIGNLYNSPGEIMRLSKLNDNDYQECLDEGMTEEEYFEQAFILQQDDLKGEMRDSWVEETVE